MAFPNLVRGRARAAQGPPALPVLAGRARRRGSTSARRSSGRSTRCAATRASSRSTRASSSGCATGLPRRARAIGAAAAEAFRLVVIDDDEEAPSPLARSRASSAEPGEQRRTGRRRSPALRGVEEQRSHATPGVPELGERLGPASQHVHHLAHRQAPRPISARCRPRPPARRGRAPASPPRVGQRRIRIGSSPA